MQLCKVSISNFVNYCNVVDLSNVTFPKFSMAALYT